MPKKTVEKIEEAAETVAVETPETKVETGEGESKEAFFFLS